MHCAGWQSAVLNEVTDRGSVSDRKEATMLKSALTGGILLLAYSIVFTMMCVVGTAWRMMTPIRWSERAWGGTRPLQ